MDWCFRKTSTNNHIGGYELEALPFPVEIPSVTANKISTLADHILIAKRAAPISDTSALERDIDKLVYKLYGLSEEEINIIEQ
jgi:hypothetical protein